MSTSLSDRDLTVLEFARNRWRLQGPRETAVRETFGMSLPRYSQVLARVLEDPGAVAYDPILVRQLRAMNERRTTNRLHSRAKGFRL